MISLSPIVTLIVLQVAAIAFAVVAALQNAPAVDSFNKYGLADWPGWKVQIARFHRYNNWIKFLFCVICSLLAGPEWLGILITGFVCGLWIYLVFDIVLSKAIGKPWHYQSRNDPHGRFWILSFTEETAGKWKALILSASIIITNLLRILL